MGVFFLAVLLNEYSNYIKPDEEIDRALTEILEEQGLQGSQNLGGLKPDLSDFSPTQSFPPHGYQ